MKKGYGRLIVMKPEEKIPTDREINEDLRLAMEEYGVKEDVCLTLAEKVLAFVKDFVRREKRPFTSADIDEGMGIKPRQAREIIRHLRKEFLVQIRPGLYLPKVKKT